MSAIEDTRPLRAVPAGSNGNGRANGHAHTNGHRTARVPPSDTGAEKDLLGAILLNPQALDEVMTILRPGDFYKPAHQHIYTAMLDLVGLGEPIDVRTVPDALARAGVLDQCGGHAGITDLIVDVPFSKHLERYAHIVKSHATRRGLISIAGEITEMGYDQTEDIDRVLDRAEQMLYDLGDSATEAGHAEVMATVLHTWIDELDRRLTQSEENTVRTGLADLDDKLTGLKPGQLLTVCGRPGSGKSIFGIQCGTYISAHHQRPALVVSAEMPTEEIVDRIVAAEGRIDNQRIRTGHLGDQDWTKITNTVSRFANVPLYLYDAPAATLASIRAEIRRVTAKTGPLGIIVVDYLQLLTTAGKAENRQVEVAELSRGLKRLARDLRVPVLALAQVNRNLENRADKRPTLADLRESGAIEADSDVVIGVYRDEMYNPDSADVGTAELIILKQRGGPTGTVRVAYLAHFGKFTNMARV